MASEMEHNTAESIDNGFLNNPDTGQMPADLDFIITVKKEEVLDPENADFLPLNKDDAIAENPKKSLRDSIKVETDEIDFSLLGNKENNNYVLTDLDDLQSTTQQDTESVSADVSNLTNNTAGKQAAVQNSRNKNNVLGETEQHINYQLTDHNYALITEHKNSTTDTSSAVSLEEDKQQTSTDGHHKPNNSQNISETQENSNNMTEISVNDCEIGGFNSLNLVLFSETHVTSRLKNTVNDLRHCAKNGMHMMDLKINVENWGPRLDNSSKFCKNCKTLFHTEDNLHAHSVSICLATVASEPMNIDKSTTRNKSSANNKKYTQRRLITSETLSKNINKSIKENSKAKSNLFHCKSCDIYFLSESALERHAVCSHVKGKIETCHLCELRFTKRCLAFHYRLHHDKTVMNRERLNTIDNESPRKTRNVKASAVKYNGDKKSSNLLAEKSLTNYKRYTQRRIITSETISKNINRSIKENSNAKRKTRNVKASAIKYNRDKTSSKNDMSNVKPALSLMKSKKIEQLKCSITENRSSIKNKSCALKYNGQKKSSYNNKKKITPARPLGKGKHFERQKSDEENRSSRKNEITTVLKDKGAKFPSDKCIENMNTLARLPENVLYKCSTCSVCFWHVRILKSHDHCNVKSRKCAICGLTFSKFALSAHISFHHDKLKLMLEDFDIRDYTLHVSEEIQQSIAENVPELLDIEKVTTIYQHLKTKRKLKKTHTPKGIRQTLLISQLNYERIIYKCAKCDCCFLTKGTLKDHIVYCSKNSRYSGNFVKCPQCGYTFTRISITRHFLIHHKKMKLNREDLFIRTNMLPLSNAEVEELDKAYSKRIKAADPDERIEIAKALYANKVKKETAKRRPSDNILYRCNDCLVCFWNLNTAKVHNHKNEIRSRKCCLCGLMFTRQSLLTHVVFHHEKQKLNLEDFEIRKIEDVKNVNYKALSNARKEHRKMLFMCIKCENCFLNETSIRRHNCQRKGSKKCVHCSYRFTWRSMLRHVKLHHEKKQFQRVDFYICKKSPTETKGNCDGEEKSLKPAKNRRNINKETKKDYLINDIAIKDSTKNKIENKTQRNTRSWTLKTLKAKTNDKELNCSGSKLEKEGIEKKRFLEGNNKDDTKRIRRGRRETMQLKNSKPDKPKKSIDNDSEQGDHSNEVMRETNEKTLKTQSTNNMKPGFLAENDKELNEIENCSDDADNTDNSRFLESIDISETQSGAEKIDIFKCTPDEVYRLLCASGKRHQSDSIK